MISASDLLFGLRVTPSTNTVQTGRENCSSDPSSTCCILCIWWTVLTLTTIITWAGRAAENFSLSLPGTQAQKTRKRGSRSFTDCCSFPPLISPASKNPGSAFCFPWVKLLPLKIQTQALTEPCLVVPRLLPCRRLCSVPSYQHSYLYLQPQQ